MLVTENAYRTIYEKIDAWSLQVPGKTKDEIYQDMLDDITYQKAFPFEKDGVVFYIVPETRWLYRLHLFSTAKSYNICIDAGKFLTNFIFDNTSVEKLYGITPLTSLIKVSKKFGWVHEGTLKSSFMSKEQILKDQYLFGVTRNENKIWRNK